MSPFAARYRISIIFLYLLVWGIGTGSASIGTPVKIGIFQNRPLSYTDETGRARGIYPDLAREIAVKENWDLTFIVDDWAGCLKKLKTGDIDLIVSIARSKNREKNYDFSHVPVVTAWGQVYSSKNHRINNILDLEKKNVGVVEKDITGRNLQNLANKFKVNTIFTHFPVYRDLCRALTEGKVDAVVMSNISGADFQREFSLTPTPIIFSPVDIYFAAPQGRHQTLLSAIDTRLAKWKKDKTSMYYTILSRWHGGLGEYKSRSLKWIGILSAMVGAVALALFAWNRMLGRQVHLRTRALEKSKQEIERTHKRFTAILNGIESTIYVADVNTHEILFMNDHMRKLFKTDLTGQICYKAFRDQDVPCPHCTNRFLLDEDNNTTGVHLWEEKHPITGRWNIYHDRAIKWVDGRMARLQIASDVTRLKEMELKQKEYEEQIRQAQKMEALGALASGIAHDFNNILFPILGYAELLNEEFKEDPAHQKSLAEILTGAQRARDLVDQILIFSRQSDQKMGPLKPDIVIKEVIKLMQSTLPSTIRIKKYVAPDCKMILADPTQVHQIAMNLMTNAFHAMEKAGGTLGVRLENIEGEDHGLSRPGPHIRLRVSDTGPGMDKKTSKKIFDPYFTTKPKGKGTGLGLALVHGIVQKYRGEIQLDSEPGKGTQFDIFIPARDVPETKKIEGREITHEGGSEYLLLVDDEAQILKLEKAVLRRMGYQVDTAESSTKALALVTEFPERFDLVITDMTMPEMTGDLLTEKIKEIVPHLPIIVCTGYSNRIPPERAKELGVKAVLTKPVAKSVLTDTVRAVLDGTYDTAL